MDATEDTYECPVHKSIHQGQKRSTFETEHFQALLNAPMKLSYQLYKQVKHGCHCPGNYAAFDSLVLGAEKQGDPKEYEQTSK
jgi:hypothetical protein